MNRQLSPDHPRFGGDARLLQLALTFLAAGAVLAVAELLALGTVTMPAAGLSVVGVVLVPAGLVRMSLDVPGPEAEGPADDDDGGDGSDVDPELLPPTGGLEIDWERFEREFYAYAEAHTLVGAPA